VYRTGKSWIKGGISRMRMGAGVENWV